MKHSQIQTGQHSTELHICQWQAVTGGIVHHVTHGFVAVQDVLDNNVTLKSDTVVHVWKWWPAAAATNHSAQQPTESASLSQSMSAESASLSQSVSAESASLSQSMSAQSRPHASQQSGQQPYQPEGCQLRQGCPGDIGSYSAGEEPGWFPEMEKFTAQVRYLSQLWLHFCGSHDTIAYSARHTLCFITIIILSASPFYSSSASSSSSSLLLSCFAVLIIQDCAG